MTSLLSFAFLLVGSQAVRLQVSNGNSLVDSASLSSLSLEPFDVILTITNKREIMDNMATSWFGWAADYMVSDETFTKKMSDKLTTMLPTALAEKGMQCTFEEKRLEGLTATLRMEILDFNIADLLTMAKGEDFANALLTMKDIFPNLGMEDKWAEIEGKIGSKVRAGLMNKLPEILAEKLGEQGVKADISTDPAAPPMEDAPPTPEQAPSYDLFFHVVIRDREPLAQAIDSSLKSAIVRKMPQAKFLDLVQKQLLEKVSEGLQEKMGSGLNITITTVPDEDAGSKDSRESFWLLVHVASIEVSDLLSRTKGPEYAGNFTRLLGVLETLRSYGMESMGVMIQNIQVQIDNQVLGGLGSTLPEMLTKSLGAEVHSTSMSVFSALQDVAPTGRCCQDATGGAPRLWWVPAELARGGGPMGFGYGQTGHCPKVIAKKEVLEGDHVVTGCVAQGFAQVRKATQTEYRPYTDCFQLSLENLQFIANPIEGTC